MRCYFSRVTIQRNLLNYPEIRAQLVPKPCTEHSEVSVWERAVYRFTLNSCFLVAFLYYFCYL
ncbi:hypothetical protein KsCSTR_49030 [Candidatus Kuenenia stuttgartiensis]|jgi:hypothetical protein|uniref:Uncharacterized protein n=1 Tax=Kuenenia stuttgartiensis TaxID=174633 RepID=Q1PVJ2_KUEST|nr:hypothetical protein KsCSTR_49030 [Candidatus Kuenenia stuttgartiensis]CAJ71245.1 unknown protein [Candidatus Kuenenia stuttgartiensis]SOH04697.1 hypothetical protein KSMBR1_2200 [Candidatus Kuenenia stuttgartiensis]